MRSVYSAKYLPWTDVAARSQQEGKTTKVPDDEALPRFNGARHHGNPPIGKRFTQGNPGRPAGSRHRVTLAVESLMDGEAEGLSRKAVELAMAGDTAALRICLDRIAPVRKSRPSPLALPRLKDIASVVEALADVVVAASVGSVTVEEAAGFMGLLDAVRRGLETLELARRLEAVEEKLSRDLN